MKLKNSQIEAAFVCFREIGRQKYPALLVPKLVNAKRATAGALDDYNEKRKDRIDLANELIKEDGADSDAIVKTLNDELEAIANDEVEIEVPKFRASEILIEGVNLEPNQVDFLDEAGILDMKE